MGCPERLTALRRTSAPPPMGTGVAGGFEKSEREERVGVGVGWGCQYQTCGARPGGRPLERFCCLSFTLYIIQDQSLFAQRFGPSV